MFKLKKPALGFVFTVAAAVFSVVALALFITTYNVGGYTLSRWALTCTVIALWLLICLAANAFAFGDKPVWGGVVYALCAFLLIYGFMQFIQPCLTPIGFIFGAGDLNMGDTALNKIVAERSIVTAVFYVLAVAFTVTASFCSAENKTAARREG